MNSFRTLIALALCAPLLFAQDDRDRTTPAGTYWNTGMSQAAVQNLVGQGWRLTDIEIESTSPWLFTVSAVQNTGSYAKGWAWYVGVTGAQLGSYLSTNNGRLTDLEPYDDNGTTKFVAIMIGNSGADQKSWQWGYDMTTAQISASVSANNGRLTNLERYTKNGQTRYAVTMIANSGTDYRSWGYLYAASAATISQNMAQYGNRVYDLERIGTDSYDAILVQNAGFGHWLYFDQSAAQVTELLQQNLARLIDVERHSTLLGTRFNVVLLDNANPLEQTVRSVFLTAPADGLGDYGFYLKEVNGPVLAQMRPDTTFEPASTMKTLYHVHAMKRVEQLGTSFTQSINKPQACLVPGTNFPLNVLLRQMMENSDNLATLAVSNFFSIPSINATGAALGMSSTSVNFTIGCSGPSPESTLTLRDLAQLHEQVANGYLGSRRADFYELMLEEPADFPSWSTTRLSSLITAEAATMGWPTSRRTAFLNAMHMAWKPGGIGFPNPNWVYYFAEGGYLKLPFKNALGVITDREYVFGVFNHRFYQNEIPGREAMSSAELVLVWDRVQAAMQTWDNFTPGSFTTFGSGCAGSNGTPGQTVAGSAEIGFTPTYHLNNGPANSAALVSIGFSNASHNGVLLPYSLTAAGAPGCSVLSAPTVAVFRTIFANGSSAYGIPVPANRLFLGMQWYTQWFVLDPAANSLGLTTTPAIRTEIGGWL